MGKKKVKNVCEYCNKSFDDDHESRRRHFNGRNHKNNVKMWYDSFHDQARHADAALNQFTSHEGNQKWTRIITEGMEKNHLSNQVSPALENIRDLPPSMLPAPPGAFSRATEDWG